MTSQIQELLLDRAGHEDLPVDIGPDPDPNEPVPPEPEQPVLPRRVLHLTQADFIRAADMLTVELAAIRAVAEIEAASRGFLPDGRPQILYEAHVFGRLTNHRFINLKDRAGKALSSRSWDRTLYGASGNWQHDERLAPAAKVDWDAAHKACSWGYFQVMGFNHASVGHATIRAFVNAVNAGAGEHLDLFVRFLRSNRLDVHLRRRDWAAFARGYNGPGYAANQYDTKLAAAYRKWAGAGSTTPTLRRGAQGEDVARLQRMINNATEGLAALRDDGVFGQQTEDAVKAFQLTEGLTADGVCGPRTWEALAKAAD